MPVVPVTACLLRVLDSGRWDYTGQPDAGGATFPVDGEAGSWTAEALADDYAATVAFCSIAPFEVYTDRLEPLAQYLFQVNATAATGGFDLLWNESVVRYKTAFDFTLIDRGLLDATPVMEQVIAGLLNVNLSMFDLHLRAIESIVVDGVSPERVLRQP